MKFLMTQSLTARLTILYTLAALTVLLVVNAATLYSVNRHFISLDQEMLFSQLTRLQATFREARSQEDLQNLLAQPDGALMTHYGEVLAITGPEGNILFASKGVSFPDSVLQQSSFGSVTEPIVWQDGEKKFRSIGGELETSYAGGTGGGAVIALEISHHEIFLSAFGRSMWGIVIVSAFFMGGLGWIVSRHGLSPLRKMVAEASKVTANRLNRRLSVDTGPVELRQLARTLNDMLGRLEESFKRLSDFASDLAHELRTPISSIMTQTQVSLSRARTEEECREILYSNAEELEHMARMVSDMLFLAKADNGLVIPNTETIRLEEEIESLFELYDALAETHAIRLVAEGSGSVAGDRSMLRRAVSNLLSNAITHSRNGSDIRVRIEPTSDEMLRLTVENQGETIAPEHLSRLFDRFYRVDASRHRRSEGVGLGLAITQSIILAHRGTITATSENGRTCFTVTLPFWAEERFPVDAARQEQLLETESNKEHSVKNL